MKMFILLLFIFSVPVFANDHFVDSRDGQQYPIVKIGDQNWMGRDLSYQVKESYCYQDKEDCPPNGRLYSWVVAMKACPDGWHVPSDDEWQKLEKYLGMPEEQLGVEQFRGTNQGAQLRRAGSSGFNAPITGYRRPDGSYARNGERSAYWLASEVDDKAAWHRDIRSDDDRIYRSSVPKEYALSVRCLQD
jgi:uncharacterized protein (TIGR02145 family)